MIEYIKKYKEKIANTANIVILRGNNVICEICGWHGKKFPNNKCPKCNSLPRTRLIPFSINHFGVSKKEISLLHVAVNEPEYKYVTTNFDFIQYDRLDILKKKYVNLVQDLANTDILDNQYDFILIWHVLEHIPNDVVAISEMYRILKPNGKLLVSVPIYPIDNPKTYEDTAIERSEFERIHGHDDHCRSCGLDYCERFEKVGFKTSTLHVKQLQKDIINKYGLSNNHTAWLFEK